MQAFIGGAHGVGSQQRRQVFGGQTGRVDREHQGAQASSFAQGRSPRQHPAYRSAQRRLLDDDWQAALDAESEELAVRLREGISELPVPTLDALMDTVYVEHNAPLRRQRDEYLAYEASFADAEGADA